jgi:hypothetical protein
MANKNISGGVVHDMPVDLREALTVDSKALALWESLTPLARNEWICWVTFVKKVETRNEHVQRTISELKDGCAGLVVGWVAFIAQTNQLVPRFNMCSNIEMLKKNLRYT